jgi:hypothetical protein
VQWNNKEKKKNKGECNMNRSECDTSRLSDLIASGGKLFPGSQSLMIVCKTRKNGPLTRSKAIASGEIEVSTVVLGPGGSADLQASGLRQ